MRGTTYRAITLGLAFALLCSAGFRHRKKMVHADETHAGQTLRIAAGDSLQLELTENPTTGYRWQITSPASAACVLRNDEFVPHGRAVPGQGGTHRWNFLAAKPGAYALELLYRRGWERDAPPARTYRLQVEVHARDRGGAPSGPPEPR